MLKKLKLLLKLRSWAKSMTLQGGGAVGALGAIQIFLQGEDGMGILEHVAAFIGLTGATTSGLALGVVGLAMLALRAKTERSLADK